MEKLLANLGGRKFVITVIGILAITAMIFTDQEFETIKWFAMFMASIVGAYNIGQGISDGLSNGRTSTKHKNSSL